jgi:hypothetical protein
MIRYCADSLNTPLNLRFRGYILLPLPTKFNSSKATTSRHGVASQLQVPESTKNIGHARISHQKIINLRQQLFYPVVYMVTQRTDQL